MEKRHQNAYPKPLFWHDEFDLAGGIYVFPGKIHIWLFDTNDGDAVMQELKINEIRSIHRKLTEIMRVAEEDGWTDD